MNIKKAVIPAAGLGTRFLPATKAQPKEMLPVVDKPAIQYIVEEAVASGIESIIIVTGRNKRSIEDHFDRSFEIEQTLEEKGKNDVLEQLHDISNLANIHYIRQKEPLGLGHAVLSARQFIGDEPFAVLLGDDLMVSEKPALQQLIDIYDQVQTDVIGVQHVAPEDVSKYGIIDPGAHTGPLYEIADLVEKPTAAEAPSMIAVMGRYILEPSTFTILEALDRGAGGEIQLTDALRKKCAAAPIHAVCLEGQRHDIGDKFGYLRAGIEMALQRPDMREQVLAYLESLRVGMTVGR
ncbi:UTP--glucose-1-phosphate uridylyltransferase [Domibacillus enclensis]|uniref:UTP--glucose-1-phosphate uridylyltransferase n=2 Tax=Domibacillus enclensis TaxID=1017273 RepID=A0A1N6XSD9_9BACI|nr:UTP--glucose-1-phosphate uridylyltransferase [Domibacillus enclensis]SIR05139.1 UDP-glucose pyrophosphorylase [Domibacillus enclensis]